MTTATDPGIDFDFFTADVPEPETKSVGSDDTGIAPAATASDPKDALNDIAKFLTTGDTDDDSAETPDAKTEPEAKAEENKDETKVKQPVTHDPRLLYAASEWGISADEAASYPTAESLISVIRAREARYQQAQIAREASEKVASKQSEQEYKIPEIDFDKIDFDDPEQSKGAVKQLYQAMTAQNEAHKKEREALQGTIKTIQSELEQASVETNQSVQEKIVRAFDEEVKTWGDEFVDLLGVPSESVRSSGPKAEAVRKLNEHVVLLQEGYKSRYGRPSPEKAVELTREFLRQARYAVYPDMATKQAKQEVSKKLKNQRGGGAALRNSAAKSTEQPEQGDRAARNAVSDYMNSIGVDLWDGRRKTG